MILYKLVWVRRGSQEYKTIILLLYTQTVQSYRKLTLEEEVSSMVKAVFNLVMDIDDDKKKEGSKEENSNNLALKNQSLSELIQLMEMYMKTLTFFNTIIYIGKSHQKTYQVILSEYRAVLRNCYKGTDGGSGDLNTFEDWLEEKFNKYNINTEVYNHTNISKRPPITMEN